MAQIAQQDNLIIEITGALAAMDETTKQKLIDCIKVGTITDVSSVNPDNCAFAAKISLVNIIFPFDLIKFHCFRHTGINVHDCNRILR